MEAHNRQAVRRFLAAWNRRDLDAIRAAVTDDHVYRAATGRIFRGKQGLEEVLAAFSSAVRQFEVGIVDLVAEGDRVACVLEIHGAFSPPFDSPDPMRYTAVGVFRLRDGRIAEQRYFDDLFYRLQRRAMS